MKIIDSESYNDAWSVKFKLDELISCIKDLQDQDYLNLAELEKARDEIKADMEEYKQSLRNKLKVKEGDIFMTTSSDGISGVRREFYYIKKIDTNKPSPEIEFDYLEVFEGDFKRKISYSEKESDYLECFLNTIANYKQEMGTQVLVGWNYYTNLLNNA